MMSPFSWCRFAGRTLAAALGRAGRPTKLVFVVTRRCYSRCTYCDIWKTKDAPGALDAELTLPEIWRLAAANPQLHWIDFTGGEPTDRPDFFEVVKAFADNCPDLLLVHFPTNGLATDRIRRTVLHLRETMRARLVVTVSIDGPPALNDRLRGVHRDFEHAVATYAAVRKLLGARHTFVGLTLHAHSGSAGMSCAQLVQDTFAAVNAELARHGEEALDWAELHANIPHLSQHYYGNTAHAGTAGFGGAAHRREIAGALETLAAQPKARGALIARAIERIYRYEARRYLSGARPSVPCAALQTTVHLSSGGEVYPCSIWNKPLGNIRDHSYKLQPIVEAARQVGVRSMIARGRCPNCWTPCEAYPSIMAAPLRALRALFAG
ncbi:MAG: radical SAM protein [Opitutaceae bacterium]